MLHLRIGRILILEVHTKQFGLFSIPISLMNTWAALACTALLLGTFYLCEALRK